MEKFLSAQLYDAVYEIRGPQTPILPVLCVFSFP
jgi:hypothetical protein